MTNAEKSLATAMEWMAEGRIHVSPAEAATVLHCDQEGLTAAYNAGDRSLPAFKSGRNLRIMVAGLVRLLKGGEDPFTQAGPEDTKKTADCCSSQRRGKC